jgi:SAM-dependent methyltransferase
MEKYLVDLFESSVREKSQVPGWLIRLYLNLFGIPLGKTIRIDMVRELLRGYEVKGKRILDVGCGVGDLSFMLAQKGADVIGVELDAQKVASANKTAEKWQIEGLRFIAADVTKLEQMSLGQFDMIFCIALVEHIKDDVDLLRQVHSLLRPGGQFIMEVPSALRKTIPAVEEEDGHQRPGYVFEEVPALLERVGLKVQRKCKRDPLGLFYYWCLFSRLVPGPKGRGRLFAVLAPIFIPLIRLTSLLNKQSGTEIGFIAVKEA